MSGPVIRRRSDAFAALAGLVLFVACAIVAADGTVGPAELAVFHAINELPQALSPFMHGVQWLGVLAVGPIVATVAALFRRWRLAIACLLVTIEKLVAERIVWELVERSRPGTTIEDAFVRGDTPTAGASFVSGHVTLLTGLAWSSPRTCEAAGARCRGRSSPWSHSPASTWARTRRSTCSEGSGWASSSAASRTSSSDWRSG